MLDIKAMGLTDGLGMGMKKKKNQGKSLDFGFD